MKYDRQQKLRDLGLNKSVSMYAGTQVLTESADGVVTIKTTPSSAKHIAKMLGDGVVSLQEGVVKFDMVNDVQPLNENVDIDPAHEGDLHKALGIPVDQDIPKEDLEKALKSDDEHIRKMAQYAINAEKWKKV